MVFISEVVGSVAVDGFTMSEMVDSVDGYYA